MRSVATLLAVLMSALLAVACSNFQREAPADPSVPFSPYAKPQQADFGPGCYDHRGRIERTITTAGECAVIGWVWRS